MKLLKSFAVLASLTVAVGTVVGVSLFVMIKIVVLAL